MKRKLQVLEEATEADIHLKLLTATLKKLSNWKTQGHDWPHEFWFLKTFRPSTSY